MVILYLYYDLRSNRYHPVMWLQTLSVVAVVVVVVGDVEKVCISGMHALTSHRNATRFHPAASLAILQARAQRGYHSGSAITPPRLGCCPSRNLLVCAQNTWAFSSRTLTLFIKQRKHRFVMIIHCSHMTLLLSASDIGLFLSFKGKSVENLSWLKLLSPEIKFFTLRLHDAFYLLIFVYFIMWLFFFLQ